MGLSARIEAAKPRVEWQRIINAGLSPRIKLRAAIRSSKDGGLLVHAAIERGELAMPR